MNATKTKTLTYTNFEVFARVRPLQNYEILSNKDSQRGYSLSGVASPIQAHLIKQFQRKRKPREIVKIENDVVFVKDNEYGLIDKRGKAFRFDAVFGPKVGNREIFRKTFKNKVKHVLDGYNTTLLAYGITGTGKTFTIFGNQPQKGLSSLVVQELFKQIDEQNLSQNIQF